VAAMFVGERTMASAWLTSTAAVLAPACTTTAMRGKLGSELET